MSLSAEAKRVYLACLHWQDESEVTELVAPMAGSIHMLASLHPSTAFPHR